MSSTDPTAERLGYSIQEVASLLGVKDAETVKGWMALEEHPLVSFKIGRVWRVHRDRLEDFIRQHSLCFPRSSGPRARQMFNRPPEPDGCR